MQCNEWYQCTVHSDHLSVLLLSAHRRRSVPSYRAVAGAAMRAVQALQGARSLVQVLRRPSLLQSGGRRSFTVQPDNILYSDYEGIAAPYIVM